MRLRISHVFRKATHRQVRIHRQDQRVAVGDHGDRGKILGGIVWQRLEQEWIGGDWAVAGTQKGLAVWSGVRHVAGCQYAVAARAVFDSKRLLERSAERLCDPAASRYLGDYLRACWR